MDGLPTSPCSSYPLPIKDFVFVSCGIFSCSSILPLKEDSFSPHVPVNSLGGLSLSPLSFSADSLATCSGRPPVPLPCFRCVFPSFNDRRLRFFDPCVGGCLRSFSSLRSSLSFRLVRLRAFGATLNSSEIFSSCEVWMVMGFHGYVLSPRGLNRQLHVVCLSFRPNSPRSIEADSSF